MLLILKSSNTNLYYRSEKTCRARPQPHQSTANIESCTQNYRLLRDHEKKAVPENRVAKGYPTVNHVFA